MAITAQEIVDQRFRAPAIADYMANLTFAERAAFNQGKDCTLTILLHWLSSGGGCAPSDINNLDEALSSKLGFTRDGFPVDEQVPA